MTPGLKAPNEFQIDITIKCTLRKQKSVSLYENWQGFGETHS